MGFFDTLFGVAKPKKGPIKAQKVPPSVTAPVVTAAQGISPEIVAVIMASVYAMTGTRRVSVQIINPEIVAVIMASVYAMTGTRKVAVKITQVNKTWAAVGRQKLMDVRQFV